MDLPVFANDDLQIEIAAIVVGKTRVESGCRLAPCLPNFISFERAFDDIGDGSMLTARQAAFALRTESWGSAIPEILPGYCCGPTK
jgi:hypothetical protein